MVESARGRGTLPRLRCRRLAAPVGVLSNTGRPCGRRLAARRRSRAVLTARRPRVARRPLAPAVVASQVTRAAGGCVTGRGPVVCCPGAVAARRASCTPFRHGGCDPSVDGVGGCSDLAQGRARAGRCARPPARPWRQGARRPPRPGRRAGVARRRADTAGSAAMLAQGGRRVDWCLGSRGTGRAPGARGGRGRYAPVRLRANPGRRGAGGLGGFPPRH